MRLYSSTPLYSIAEVITLRMHVVNLILFENHMSEWFVFAQHNSSEVSMQFVVTSETRSRVLPARSECAAHDINIQLAYGLKYADIETNHENVFFFLNCVVERAAVPKEVANGISLTLMNAVGRESRAGVCVFGKHC